MQNDTNAVLQIAAIGRQPSLMANMMSSNGNAATCIHLSISSKGLTTMNVTPHLNPFVVVHLKNEDGSCSEIGRTEIIANSLTPMWTKQIYADHLFEKDQILLFEVYSALGSFSSNDATHLVLNQQRKFGVAECSLSLIVSNGNCGGSNVQLHPFSPEDGNGDLGDIHIAAEMIGNSNYEVSMSISVKNLCKLQAYYIGWNFPNPFFTISRELEGCLYMNCYKSEVKESTISPEWDPFSKSLATLAGGNREWPLQFKVWNKEKSGKPILLCSVALTIDELENRSGNTIRMKKELENRMYWDDEPKLVICQFKIEYIPTFFDYLLSGMELQFICAIDYTVSNKLPSSPDSLHHMNENDGKTAYSRVISDVEAILKFYDTDKKYPVFGFGAKIPGNEKAPYCFAVNGNESDPEVKDVSGIISAYHSSLSTIEFSGPTLFAPVINRAAKMVSLSTANSSKLKYHILLIITDGGIDDMPQTRDAIVAAAKLPLSIIIVGLGDANFDCMKVLDGDHVRITNTSNQEAVRDIVQFVAIRDVSNRESFNRTTEMLEEIPGAVVEYYRMMEISPRIRTTYKETHEILHQQCSPFREMKQNEIQLEEVSAHAEVHEDSLEVREDSKAHEDSPEVHEDPQYIQDN